MDKCLSFDLILLISLVLPLHCLPMLIVQSYEQDENLSLSSNSRVISVNISREVIQNEVQHSVRHLTERIQALDAGYQRLTEAGLRRERSARKHISSLQKDLKSKTTLLCQMLDYQRAIESELETLRGKVANLSLLQERVEGLTGVPAWVTKYKQKVESKKKKQERDIRTEHMMSVMYANRTGVPEWVRQWEANRTLHYMDHYQCGAFPNGSMIGVPQWVREYKLRMFKSQCLKMKTTQPPYDVMTSYQPQSHGYEDTDKVQTEDHTSRKSTRRKIDEIFLKLMIRSKHLNWIDIERIGENLALFVDHMKETGKLCSVAAVSLRWESVEDCKEKIGLNFTMSILTALVATVLMIGFLIVSVLLLLKLKVKLSELYDSSSSSDKSHIIHRIQSVISKIKVENFMEPPRALKSLITVTQNVCIITTSQAATEAAASLIERLIQSNSELPIKAKPLFHLVETTADIKSVPEAPKCILLLDVAAVSGGILFDETQRKHCLNFRIIEELNSKTDLLLLCINDVTSRQLPRGRLYNRALVASNDNYLLRTLCRTDKFISINNIFTQSQAVRIRDWLRKLNRNLST